KIGAILLLKPLALRAGGQFLFQLAGLLIQFILLVEQGPRLAADLVGPAPRLQALQQLLQGLFDFLLMFERLGERILLLVFLGFTGLLRVGLLRVGLAVLACSVEKRFDRLQFLAAQPFEFVGDRVDALARRRARQFVVLLGLPDALDLGPQPFLL